MTKKACSPMRVTFNKNDTFSLYYTLGHVIIEGLTAYKADCQFYPTEGFSSMAQWQEALDAMIWSFEHTDKDDFESDTQRELFEAERDRGMQLFTKHFRDLWW